MNNVWKNKFENVDKKLPSMIATEYCNPLYELTQKKVIAKVEKYKLSIDSLTSEAPIFNNAKGRMNLFNSINVQSFLGEVEGTDEFTYELYLSGSKTPNYKYRFCFIEYGINLYPVKIVVDSDIASELQISEAILCNNEKEYTDILKLILNSEKLTDIIESLMSLNS